MGEQEKQEYGLGAVGPDRIVEAPALPYRPKNPERYSPGIGLIGCGGISEMHLKAYRHAGYDVRALCSRTEAKAVQRRTEFFPDADVYTDYHDLLKRDDIAVVDITTHPAERVPIIEAALKAGGHVLSQKPFVIDLDTGERLAALADACGVCLAVNQNGRWAPHFSYIRHLVQEGLLGRVISADMSVHWNANWIADTVFNDIEHLILYDFAIHWFDIVTVFMGDRDAKLVTASVARSPGQKTRPPLMAQALIEYDDAQATLHFNGDTRYGQEDRTSVVGTEGTVSSVGVDLTAQKVTLYTASGRAEPFVEGTWFLDGFHGAMAELLCAVEENRPPLHNARDNLRSLALCFAAVESSARGEPVVPDAVRRLPGG